jgi:hypothetical protein
MPAADSSAAARIPASSSLKLEVTSGRRGRGSAASTSFRITSEISSTPSGSVTALDSTSYPENQDGSGPACWPARSSGPRTDAAAYSTGAQNSDPSSDLSFDLASSVSSATASMRPTGRCASAAENDSSEDVLSGSHMEIGSENIGISSSSSSTGPASISSSDESSIRPMGSSTGTASTSTWRCSICRSNREFRERTSASSRSSSSALVSASRTAPSACRSMISRSARMRATAERAYPNRLLPSFGSSVLIASLPPRTARPLRSAGSSGHCGV